MTFVFLSKLEFLSPFISYSHLTDAQLLSNYKTDRNKDLLGELFTRHHKMVASVCFKYLADEDKAADACMSVFEQLVNTLHLHEVENFRAWVYTVARNFCLMQLRKEPKVVNEWQFSLNNLDEDVELSPGLHLEEKVAKEEKLNLMERAIEELKEEQKICIKLFYLEQKSYDEIMRVTGFDYNSVKSFIQNGKRNLKLVMDKLQG